MTSISKIFGRKSLLQTETVVKSSRTLIAALAGAVVFLLLGAVAVIAMPSTHTATTDTQVVETAATPLLYRPSYQLAPSAKKAPIYKTHSVMIDADRCEELDLPGIYLAYTAVLGSDKGACWIYVLRTEWSEGVVLGSPENVGTPPFQPTVNQIVIGVRGVTELNLTVAHTTRATPQASPVNNRDKITAYFTSHDKDVWMVNISGRVTEE